MRTNVNLVIQLATVASIALMRLLTPGWLLIIFFIFVPIGTAALVAQIVLAASVMRRGTLTPGVSAGFVLLAASGFAAAALMPDESDAPHSDHSPLGLLLGHEVPGSASMAMVLLLVWLVAAVWVLAGVAATARPTPALPPHPVRAHTPVPPGR